jgi:hypothetical protein
MTTLMGCLGDPEVAGYTVKVGTNAVDASTGANVFTEDENGKHRYVIMRHPSYYYQYQLNNILEKNAWGYRQLGAQSIDKV